VKSLQHHEPANPLAEASALEEVASWCRSRLRGDAGKRADAFEATVAERLEILGAIDADGETRAAVWLYSTSEAVGLAAVELRETFGESLASLVEGIRRMDVISNLSEGVLAGNADENFRKMLIAMIDDVRVVLVRLACQVQLLRQARDLPEARCEALGRETLEVFSPLANRLGIWQFKWELEDLAFRCIDPATYRDLARRLAERRIDRERYIDDFIALVHGLLDGAGIRGEVAGRPKHLYSIFKKMRRKQLAFDDIHDVRAVRLLVDSVADCYAALGLVHTRFPPIPGEFDDYIATPKENGYRSIHTAVVGPGGKAVEVQIRTFEMHEENELGVAAHWRYKERSPSDQATDGKIAWLRQLLEWKQEVGEGSEFFERFRNDTAEERIYVFTPRGKVIDLPAGSTPLDFAYAIHTDVGHRCRGARVNGRMVPLNTRLDTGARVEILTSRTGTPSRDWLSASLGYVKTQKARSRIQRWFKDEDFEHNAAAGRAALERELYRLGAADAAFDKLAAERGFRKVDDFLAAIGSGDLKVSQAVSPLKTRAEPRELPLKAAPAPAPRGSRGMSVQGVGNLLTQFAACCNPLPGDAIVGYITAGRGITVHRRDCRNVMRLEAARRERVIHIDWGSDDDETFPVDIEIRAFDRKGLLYDVSRVFRDANINVLSTLTESTARDHTASMRIRAEFSDVEQLSRLLAQVCQVPNVLDARRVGTPSS